MKKYRVLFITRKYPPETGGMENLCFHIAEQLPDDEFEMKVVALGRKQIHLLWFFPYALLYVIFHARAYDYLLIGDGLMCMCGNVCRWFARKVQRLVILHGLDITYQNPIYQLYLKLFLKKSCNLFICNSKNTQRIVKQWGITENTTVITPGINVNVFLEKSIIGKSEFREKYGIPNDNMILITIGRLIKRKGVSWFVEHVMPRLDHVTYLVIGEGCERNQITEAIKNNHLSGTVKLLGRVSDEEWNECYQNADVFVMPNIHVDNDVEGFGIVAAEASLAGLIVVASNLEGIPDAIQHGKNGVLVESENEEEYCKVLKEIQNNLDVYKKLAKTYSEYTREHYAWDNICERYRNEMKKLCTKGEVRNEQSEQEKKH